MKNHLIVVIICDIFIYLIHKKCTTVIRNCFIFTMPLFLIVQKSYLLDISALIKNHTAGSA